MRAKPIIFFGLIIILTTIYFFYTPASSVPVPDPASPVIVSSPAPEEFITSPLTITGSARGFWFFEASFPVILTDWDGLIIAQGIATAESDWMTENYVSFHAELTFTKPGYGERGTLILKKDNPSGLPEHDAAVEIPIRFR